MRHEAVKRRGTKRHICAPYPQTTHDTSTDTSSTHDIVDLSSHTSSVTHTRHKKNIKNKKIKHMSKDLQSLHIDMNTTTKSIDIYGDIYT